MRLEPISKYLRTRYESISALPRSEDEGVLAARRERSDAGNAEIGHIPRGLRQGSRPAVLRLGRGASSTASSVRLAEAGNLLATRAGGISRWVLGMLSIGIFLIATALGIAVYFWGFHFPGRGRQAAASVGGHTFEVEVRDTAAGRAQGLSGRGSLGENEGMLFVFGSPGDYGFWMKDMEFPIDIVWIREGRVVGVTERAAPEPGKNMFRLTIYHPPAPADTVLEIGAGAAARYGIKAGDAVELR